MKGSMFVVAANAADVSVQIDWTASWKTVSTAATFEVDHMPFLARDAQEGGTFEGYYRALQNLGASYVRFAPWMPYPRVAVTELYPPDCSTNGQGSSWNATLLDGVMADFMSAVCGPDAVKGTCIDGHSVAPMITTIPAWMYEGGDDKVNEIPEDPWRFPSGNFDYYKVIGKPLKDPTCQEMARYAARIVEWYTKGGTTDECGVRHQSGLYYDWPLVSVLNEDEYRTPPGGGVEYTVCWDAWKEEIAKVNPKVGLVGPEAVSDLRYNLYFLNGTNHADGQPPAIVANHMFMQGPPWSNLFTGVDSWVRTFAVPLDNARQEMAPDTEMVMNEFIPFNNDWCAASEGNGCPNWKLSSSQGTKINRKTLGWNAAAASFAYGFSRMAELGYKYVTADQLVAGPWPDNEPAVASLDWETGDPNAKYWAVQMLATGLGPGPKTLFNSTVKGEAPPAPPTLTGCFVDNATSPISYAGGNLWGDKHIVNHTNSSEACCQMCQDYASKGCVFWQYDSNGCYGSEEGCCRLKTAEAWQGRGPTAAATTSGSIEPLPPTPAPLYGLAMQIQGNRRLLLVSKSEKPQSVQIEGGQHAAADVLEGVGDEPGFAPPASRSCDGNGTLTLGPFGVALVSLPADAVV